MKTIIDLDNYANTLRTKAMRDSPLNRLALTRVFRETDDTLDIIAAYCNKSIAEKCGNELGVSIKCHCKNLSIGLQTKYY